MLSLLKVRIILSSFCINFIVFGIKLLYFTVIFPVGGPSINFNTNLVKNSFRYFILRKQNLNNFYEGFCLFSFVLVENFCVPVAMLSSFIV